jgi:hypothetical protein
VHGEPCSSDEGIVVRPWHYISAQDIGISGVHNLTAHKRLHYGVTSQAHVSCARGYNNGASILTRYLPASRQRIFLRLALHALLTRADSNNVATAYSLLGNSVLLESLPYSIRGLGQYATVSDVQNILVPKLD